MKIDEYLRQTLDTLVLPYSDRELELCSRFWDLLLKTNESMNLTAITDPAEGAVKHFGDSLALLKQIPLSDGGTLIDVGSGNGFPGLALKIFCPALQVTLLDSLNKRCHFLEETVAELGLEQVNVVCARAEEAGRNKALREHFDYATARAVTTLPVLCEYAMPLLKVGGSFFAYKGGDCGEELQGARNARAALCAKLTSAHEYTLPDGEKRTLVELKKTAPTPAAYPRRPGVPNKKPIR